MLHPSDDDMSHLCRAVFHKLSELQGTFLRIRGVALAPSPVMKSDLVLWNTMIERHNKGDYRNTDDEYKALKNVAQWTHDENCILRNQPITKIEWKD